MYGQKYKIQCMKDTDYVMKLFITHSLLSKWCFETSCNYKNRSEPVTTLFCYFEPMDIYCFTATRYMATTIEGTNQLGRRMCGDYFWEDWVFTFASLIRCNGISCWFDYSISTSINYDYGFLGPWLIQDHYSRW